MRFPSPVFRAATPRGLPLGALLGAVLIAPQLQGCKGCSKNKDTDTGKVITEPEPEPFTNDWGQWLSMGVLSDGTPVAASYDRTEGGLVVAEATLTDGVPAWSFEKVDGYPDDDGLDVGDRGQYASLAVGSDDTLWVSYYDVKVRTLRYATRGADGTWTSGLADAGEGATPDAGKFTSIALDGNGNPVIAHYDAGKGRLRVAHWTGSGFTGEVVDSGEPGLAEDGSEIDADVGQFARLRISGGVEYIAYYDAANGALKLAYGNSGSYTIEVVDDSADVGQWPDLLVSSDGSPMYLSYQDVTNQDLKLAAGAPAAWTLSTVDDGDYVGADSALYKNGSYPAIAYFDGRNNDMKLAQLAGDAWTLDTVAADGALGYHNEVITAGGTHYAGCYSYAQGTVWFASLD